MMLKVSKTEVLHFTSRFIRNTTIFHITAGDSVVDLVPDARDLGVIMDSHMTMQPHTNYICRGASFALKTISSIRKYLDKPTTEKLIHAYSSLQLQQHSHRTS